MSTVITKYANQNGLKIVEAKQPLTIVVEPDDVKSAKRKDAKDCAFAKACKRQQPIKNAFFFRSMAYLEQGKKLVRYLLPMSMQKEIVSFDRTRAMVPGVYEMKAIPPSITLKAQRVRNITKPDRTGKRNKKKQIRHATQNVRTFFEQTL